MKKTVLKPRGHYKPRKPSARSSALAKARLAAGMTQEQAAAMIRGKLGRCSVCQYQRWEAGQGGKGLPFGPVPVLEWLEIAGSSLNSARSSLVV